MSILSAQERTLYREGEKLELKGKKETKWVDCIRTLAALGGESLLRFSFPRPRPRQGQLCASVGSAVLASSLSHPTSGLCFLLCLV